jgi:ADP-L-glycero-D-manno-heptose 6-epimerase
MLNDSKILVTGAAGLIGSAVIWALNKRGIDNIIAADFLGADERWKNLVPLRFRDYLEGDKLLQAIDGNTGRVGDVHYIFHLGACSATTERDCRYLIENNYEYTRRLALWALEGRRRLVYASSAATYGDGSAGMADGEGNLAHYKPLNMYGYSKHLFDVHAAKNGWLDRLVGVKYFNVFGPNEDHKGDMRSVVNKAFAQIRDTGVARLFKSYNKEYPDGGQRRDFVYVKDAVEMTLHLAEARTVAGLYNIGTGRASTWVELVTPIFRTLGLPVNIEFVEMPEALRGKYQYHTCAEIGRLLQTGWTGKTRALADAVADYVGNYLVPGRRLGEEGSA